MRQTKSDAGERQEQLRTEIGDDLQRKEVRSAKAMFSAGVSLLLPALFALWNGWNRNYVGVAETVWGSPTYMTEFELTFFAYSFIGLGAFIGLLAVVLLAIASHILLAERFKDHPLRST